MVSKEPEERRRDVSLLQNDLKHMQESFEEFKENTHNSFKELKDIMKTHILQEEQLFERLEGRFALKYIEKIVVFLCTSAGGLIISALIYQVLKK